MKKKCILQLIYAYAIMPLGKRDAKVPCEQRTKSPNRVPAQFGDSSLLLWWQSTHQAICCSCRHRLTIWWCSGKLHQPQRRLNKMQITPCEHLLPVAGIGEQHIDYSIRSDVLVLFSQRFVIGIMAITIRFPLIVIIYTMLKQGTLFDESCFKARRKSGEPKQLPRSKYAHIQHTSAAGSSHSQIFLFVLFKPYIPFRNCSDSPNHPLLFCSFIIADM